MLQAFMVFLMCGGSPAACVELHSPEPGHRAGPVCDAAAADGAKATTLKLATAGLQVVKAYCQDERPGPAYRIYIHADGTTTIAVDHH
jgi:hypothetical protein